MKFLWVSEFGDTLALAMKVLEEGNDVEFTVLDRTKRHCGNGLVPKVTGNWQKQLAKDKIIVFDMVGSGVIADKLKKQGYMVFGGSVLADKLELDRNFGLKAMEVAGIPTPESTKFNNFDEAIRHVQRKNTRFVFKPDNNIDCAYTYVSFNEFDMIHFLETLKKDSKFNGTKFVLQEYEEGIEISLEGLFNGKDWVDGWFNITLERKQKMTGDLGQATGCAIDVVKVLADQRESLMVKKTLEKITPLLKASNYQGMIDINCIWKNGMPLGLEWTTRFGLNAIFTMLELVKDDLGKIIADVCFGSNREVRSEKLQFGASVRCAVPEDPKIKNRLIQNIKDFKHIHPLDMMLDDEARLVCSDTDHVISVVTAYGGTIKKAADFVYHLINKTSNFGCLDLEYRLDCGEKASEYIEQLMRWGLMQRVSSTSVRSKETRKYGDSDDDIEKSNLDLTSSPYGVENHPFDNEAHIAIDGYDVSVEGDGESKVA